MRGTAFTTPQFAEVIGPVAKALAQALAGRDPAKVITAFNTDGVGLERALGTALDDFLAPKADAIPELPLLVFDDKHIAYVDISGEHNPEAFWQTTKYPPARYVFTKAFEKAKTINIRGIVKVPYADLSRRTTVRKILNAPGIDSHDLSKLSKIIAAMIAKQPNGEFLKDGLLHDGYGNLFPCGSVLVDAYWHEVLQLWGVRAWGPSTEVLAGPRVFSGKLIP